MPDHRQKAMIEGPIGTALLRLALPITLGNVLQTGYQLTDAFWVGRLGATAVAAVSINFPVMFLVIALGAGFAIAGATLTAQYMGAGRQDMVNHVAAQTMLMVALTSAAFGAAGYLLSPLLLRLMGVAPDVYAAALGFMHVSFVGIVFIFLYAMFQALMRGVGQTRVPLLIVLATVLLNFILDPLFIFGYGPLPAQGVVGAALATVITQGLATVSGLVIFLRGRHGIHLTWSGLPAGSALYPARIPARIARFDRTGQPRTGTDRHVVSSRRIRHGDARRLWRRHQYPAVHHHSSDGPVDGGLDSRWSEHGSRQHRTRHPHGDPWGGIGLHPSDGGGRRGLRRRRPPDRILRAGDNAVVAEGARFIRIMSLAWGGIGVQLCIVAAFRASGNMLMAMAIAVIFQLLVQIPLAYALATLAGLHAEGLWWSFPSPRS